MLTLHHRLLFAAMAGSAASLVLKTLDVLSPGMPASQVIASKHVPFFQHMLVAGWVAVLAMLAAGGLLRGRTLPPKLVVVVIVLTTAGTGALQWFFPNY